MKSPKGRILCTEDDADTRELIAYELTQAGYEVICTDNAAKALELIKRERFDLCLMDSWMPGVSGDDLCKQIREFDSKTPILFYTGAAYDADKARAYAAGAQGYLVKPSTEDELLDEVIRLIAQSKLIVPITIIPPVY
ncbi:MAG: response regulator [Pyrinomonadaceae bacterium]